MPECGCCTAALLFLRQLSSVLDQQCAGSEVTRRYLRTHLQGGLLELRQFMQQRLETARIEGPCGSGKRSYPLAGMFRPRVVKHNQMLPDL